MQLVIPQQKVVPESLMPQRQGNTMTTSLREKEDDTNNHENVGVIPNIMIAKKSAAPMESIPSAKLVAHVGIEGDRYARNIRTGTYSGRFLYEPGRNLTMISTDAIQEKMKQLPTNEKPSFGMDKLRRNVIVKGVSAQELNAMVGWEIRLGECRLFVHRRNVPCKYREAQTQCPNFMNIFWEDCGVCCEILQGGTIQCGDKLAVIPETYRPHRCNVGLKPPAFFVKPADRSLAQVQAGIISPFIAILLCLYDPVGFEQVEGGYRQAGQHFWSPQAYRLGLYFKQHVRTPLIAAASVAVVAVTIGMVRAL